jgi:hypothetical protein
MNTITLHPILLSLMLTGCVFGVEGGNVMIESNQTVIISEKDGVKITIDGIGEINNVSNKYELQIKAPGSALDMTEKGKIKIDALSDGLTITIRLKNGK